jgi:hypothetical protein
MEMEVKPEPSSIQPPDRRAHPRYAVDEEAWLLVVGHGLSMNCRVLDLSVEGCRMHSTARLPAGIRIHVEVTFSINRIPFRMGGIIQRCDGCGEVGVRFVNVTARRHAEWVEVVEEMQAFFAAKAQEEAARAQQDGVPEESHKVEIAASEEPCLPSSVLATMQDLDTCGR